MSSEMASKQKMILELAKISSVPLADVKAVLDGLEELVARRLQEDEKFIYPQFLKLEMRKRKATLDREMFQPKKGAFVTVTGKPAMKKVFVKPLSNLVKLNHEIQD